MGVGVRVGGAGRRGAATGQKARAQPPFEVFMYVSSHTQQSHARNPQRSSARSVACAPPTRAPRPADLVKGRPRNEGGTHGAGR